MTAFVPDLLFGSKVQASLAAGGHDVTLLSTVEATRAHADAADVVVVDLASDPAAGLELAGVGARTLGFYSHVDVATRERAQAAGFDLVVPRSRMSREGAALVGALAERSGS